MKKRFNEYFAKVILESCFPNIYDVLQISDKPDLRHTNSNTGIEVTYSMAAKEAEALNLWDRVKSNSTVRTRDVERLKQLGVDAQSNEFIWDQGCYGKNILEGPIKEFFEAVKQKIERLNSTNAGYADMAEYELFVNSTILIPSYQIQGTIQILKSINDGIKKFSKIYLLTNEQKLLVFDMINLSLEIKYLYDRVNMMAEKAFQMFKEE